MNATTFQSSRIITDDLHSVCRDRPPTVSPALALLTVGILLIFMASKTVSESKIHLRSDQALYCIGQSFKHLANPYSRSNDAFNAVRLASFSGSDRVYVF